MTIKRPVLRYHGGKFRLSGWIRSFFPPHQVYVEPFGGAGSVLLTKEPAYAEVYNDLDGDVVNFFRVLRDPIQRAALCELVALTPFSRAEFECAYAPDTGPGARMKFFIGLHQPSDAKHLGGGRALSPEHRDDAIPKTAGDTRMKEMLWIQN